MEKFIVSARKYRPQTFDTVVGQQHITTTLKNAIAHQQLAHAFLFCGPRGVGKTTCARILAKTINCQQRTPEGEACDVCHSCVSFNEGSSLNIFELDAASNNSVDDIRQLVEQVRFAPTSGQYKVYIIDEVHMLSASAFNAFLKTLEEPPGYAIFILATTEKHKILPTILSRCQIFDFKRITLNDTVEHLHEITVKEEISAEKEALQLIAQKSEGCMRDALSILDKIVSFTNSHVTYNNTLDHLNILDADYYFKLLDAMLEQDAAATLLLFDEINKKGFESELVLNGLAEFFRNLMVCKDAKVLHLLDVVASFKEKFKLFAEKTPLGFIVSALQIITEAEINLKSARNKRLHVELTLIKLAYLHQALELTQQGGNTIKKKRVDQPIAFRVQSLVAQPPVKKTQPAPAEAQLQIQTPKPAAQPRQSPAATPIPTDPITKTSGNRGILSTEAIRQKVEAERAAKANVQAIPATAASVREVWEGIIEDFAQMGELTTFLQAATLSLLDEATLNIAVFNTLQQRFIENAQRKILDAFQQHFRNPAFALQIEFIAPPETAATEQGPQPLSRRDQYQLLIEHYPLIKQLRDQLGLEIDY